VRSTRPVAAVVLSLLVVAVAPAVARGADWVGLGDSYAAGPLIPNQSLSPLGCLRSDHNYARLAAASTGRSLADVSCSGAKTDNMAGSQSTSAGTNPPQFNALSAATKVVSVQIGGNDIGFTEILENCVTYNPFGKPCQNRYGTGSNDQINARIAAAAPKVAAVLAGIKSRAPGARILVVNYAAILPETGSGCWPQVPFAYSDVPYLRGKQKALNTMLQQQAAAAGAVYVDDYTASIGRDACKSTGTRWVEPLVPGNAAAPFHPNARGMAGIAPVVAAASR
jgi:lysophospholipase L1-like esterase